jgi:hypothetical protein
LQLIYFPPFILACNIPVSKMVSNKNRLQMYMKIFNIHTDG